MVRKSHMKDFLGSPVGWGGSQSSLPPNRMAFKPIPHLGPSAVFLGLHVPPTLLSKGFPNRVLGGVLWGCPKLTHLYCWLQASP